MFHGKSFSLYSIHGVRLVFFTSYGSKAIIAHCVPNQCGFAFDARFGD
jgi:hypothetical protein